MKSLLTTLAIVVLVAGCQKDDRGSKKDDRGSEKAVGKAAAPPICERVEVKRPYADPTVRAKAGMFLYVFQDNQVRTVLDVEKTGDMVIPLTAVDDGKHALHYGLCDPHGGDPNVIKATCIECMTLYKPQPCCGEDMGQQAAYPPQP